MVLRLYVHIDETQSLFLAFDLYIILIKDAFVAGVTCYNSLPSGGEKVKVSCKDKAGNHAKTKPAAYYEDKASHIFRRKSPVCPAQALPFKKRRDIFFFQSRLQAKSGRQKAAGKNHCLKFNIFFIKYRVCGKIDMLFCYSDKVSQ